MSVETVVCHLAGFRVLPLFETNNLLRSEEVPWTPCKKAPERTKNILAFMTSVDMWVAWFYQSAKITS